MMSFVEMVDANHKGQHVFAATHTDNIRAIVRAALKEPISVDYKIEGHAILVIEITNGELKIRSQKGIIKRN